MSGFSEKITAMMVIKALLGMFAGLVALAVIGTLVDGCKDKLGIERHGSQNVNMEVIKARAEE